MLVLLGAGVLAGAYLWVKFIDFTLGRIVNWVDQREELERARTRVAREQARGELRAVTNLYTERDANVVWLPVRNDTTPAA